MKLLKYFLILLAAYAFLFCLLYIPRITSDGLEMYASTQSMIITQDLDFTDNFAKSSPSSQHYMQAVHNPGLGKRASQALTDTGLPFNLHPIGISLMNAPHFLVGHLISMISGNSLDGYNEVYFTAYTLGTVIYCFFGSWIIFHYLVNYLNYRKIDSMIAVLTMVAATPMLWYIFLEPSMSHGVTFFAASLFILVWLKFVSIKSTFCFLFNKW